MTYAFIKVNMVINIIHQIFFKFRKDLIKTYAYCIIILTIPLHCRLVPETGPFKETTGT